MSKGISPEEMMEGMEEEITELKSDIQTLRRLCYLKTGKIIQLMDANESLLKSQKILRRKIERNREFMTK